MVCLCVMAGLNAAAIHSYEELRDAMREGKHFTILLDVRECTGNPQMPVGYSTPTEMMWIPKSENGDEHISTSFLHFTDHGGVAKYEYVKYTFKSDESVDIQVAFYEPHSFELVGKKQQIHCYLDKGIEIFTN